MSPVGRFDLSEDRFDLRVARAFASTSQTRHVRDRLIARVHSGAFDDVLLRMRAGLPDLSEAIERRAALTIIDFAFEPLVLPSLSTAQATVYFAGVEKSLRVTEADGLEGPGPLWLDTLHHACVFSVLFQMAVHLGRRRGCDQIVLLHQGQRPEPRLGLVANLLRKLHGLAFVLVPMREGWLQHLARLTTPNTAIFSLVDMPPEAFGRLPEARRGRARLDLYAAPGIALGVTTIAGSAAFARRLGATHVVLDYPAPDRVRIRAHDAMNTLRCPLEDWIFWPLLGTQTGQTTRPTSA